MPTATSRPFVQTRTTVELLENRQLLSVDLVDGVLTVRGTPASDRIFMAMVDADGNAAPSQDTPRFVKVRITFLHKRSVKEVMFEEADVERIEVRTFGGNDDVGLYGRFNRIKTRNGGAFFVTSPLEISALIHLGSGDDRCTSGDGNDTIQGGIGDDNFSGGAGDDELRGGRGADSIFGGVGNDLIIGGKGHDLLLGAEGADTALGEGGKDFLYDYDQPTDSVDVLNGGAGKDEIRANPIDDISSDPKDKTLIVD